MWIIVLSFILWFCLGVRLIGYFFGSLGIRRLLQQSGEEKTGFAFIPGWRLWKAAKLCKNENRGFAAAFLLCGAFPAAVLLYTILDAAMLLSIVFAPLGVLVLIPGILILPVGAYAAPLLFQVLLHRLYLQIDGENALWHSVVSGILLPVGGWQYVLYFVAARSDKNGSTPVTQNASEQKEENG